MRTNLEDLKGLLSTELSSLELSPYTAAITSAANTSICELCQEEDCLEASGISEEEQLHAAFESIAEAECSNILNILEADAATQGIALTEHPEYCYYQACTINSASRVYEYELQAVSSWTSATQLGLIDPLGVKGLVGATVRDPYFDSNRNLFGTGEATNFYTNYLSSIQGDK